MISVEEAQQLILDTVVPGGVERLDILDAEGRVLAETVTAAQDFPPYDNSAMDGYAVCSRDLSQTRLTVIEVIPAGKMPEQAVGEGECARIMTGAVLPAGADAILIQEEVNVRGDAIEFAQLPQAGTHVRYRGDYHQAGDTLLKPGTVLHAGEIAILAAAQRSFVLAHRAPIVAVLSTGDELVGIDGQLQPGQIVDSNQYGLAAQIRAAGGIPRMLGIARDDPGHLRDCLESALSADFILTSGGVSVGQFDYMLQVLEEMDAEVVLYKINMKPGKPLTFARLRGRLLWGLPGNPVSALLCFWQFVRPAIRKSLGYPGTGWFLPNIPARLDASVSTKGDRRTYLRGRLALESGEWVFTPYRTDSSGDLVSLAGINGFAWLEKGIAVAESGSTVPVFLVGEPDTHTNR